MLSEDVKNKLKTTVEKDAKERALIRLKSICKRRGGKFKLSEKQFVEEMEHMWISGEFSAAERILRCIELDPELDTKDLIRGEIHLFILDLFALLKKRLDIKQDIGLEDLLWGKFATENLEFLSQQAVNSKKLEV